MVVGAKVCELTDGFLWFVCGLYVGILMSPLTRLSGLGSITLILSLYSSYKSNVAGYVSDIEYSSSSQRPHLYCTCMRSPGLYATPYHPCIL